MNFKGLTHFLMLIVGFAPSSMALAHDLGEARYIANAGVLVSAGDHKILFDPLALSGFGTYPEIMDADKTALMDGSAPFDGIDLVLISHAHRDHFSAKDILAYMNAQTNVNLVAPSQAIDMMKDEASWEAELMSRIRELDLDYGDAATSLNVDGLDIDSVRIPHAGWPAPHRAAVQNMLYRVDMPNGATVLHMGDADIRASHFTPYEDLWASKRIETAFPPYWFFQNVEGQYILRKILRADHAVGIHVPIEVPENLKALGFDYFDIPGETRTIHSHEGTK